MTDAFNFERAFRGRQNVLRAKLTAGRETFTHAGTKGASSELNWVAMLREFLPRRYSVNSAFVVDAKGNESDQQDVVIYDSQYSPILFEDEAGLYIPSESVYAAFEVKQELSKANIEYAGGKVASVRALDRTSVEIRHAGGRFDPKEEHHIIGGLLTLGSEWNPCMGEHFEKAILAAPPEEQLNLGCALECGAFDVIDTDGDTAVRTTDSELGLMSFSVRLFRQLQAIGTVQAIDIERYAQLIWRPDEE